MQPRPAGKPGGFVNVTTNYSLGAVSVTTNNANLINITFPWYWSPKIERAHKKNQKYKTCTLWY